MPIRKSLRIPSSTLPQLFKKGSKFNFNSFNIILSSSKAITAHRVTVSVSKKIDKRATVRNKIKRLIYNAYKLIDEKNNLKPGNILIVASKTVINKKQEDLENELYKALIKTGLISNEKSFT